MRTDTPLSDNDTVENPEEPVAPSSPNTSGIDRSLVTQLVGQARAQGLAIDGENGLLAELTKIVVESALDGELTDPLGYEKNERGHADGNARNGTRTKTVQTKGSPIAIDVPRGRAGTFEPMIVKKRQRRLGSIEDVVLSLSARGMTHGDIAAHLADVYGTEVSKTTISTITDKVLDGMNEWQNRPLDPVYPVVFIDAIHVKVRDGQVANRPIYVALAVTTEGHRDILGLWAGDGGEGAGSFRERASRAQVRVHGGDGAGSDGEGPCPVDAAVEAGVERFRYRVRWSSDRSQDVINKSQLHR